MITDRHQTTQSPLTNCKYGIEAIQWLLLLWVDVDHLKASSFEGLQECFSCSYFLFSSGKCLHTQALPQVFKSKIILPFMSRYVQYSKESLAADHLLGSKIVWLYIFWLGGIGRTWVRFIGAWGSRVFIATKVCQGRLLQLQFSTFVSSGF